MLVFVEQFNKFCAMKQIFKYCLILVSIILSNNLFSQSLISENKLWRTVFKSYSDPCCINAPYALKFKGDSIINDTIYTKLLESKDESLGKWTLNGLWRETKDKKVFRRDLSHQNETLLYDFSLEKNDTFHTHGLTFKVDSVLNKTWGGKLRKHWYLNTYRAETDSADKHYSTLWIEDVGRPGFFPDNINKPYGAISYLLCFSEDGQMVYKNPQFNTCFLTSTESISRAGKQNKVYPNPATSELLIEGDFDKEAVLELYSTQGELVKTECMDGGGSKYRIDIKTLRSGIYVLRVHSTKGKYLEEVIVKK